MQKKSQTEVSQLLDVLHPAKTSTRQVVFRCEEIDPHREGLLLRVPQPLENESLVVS